MKISAPHILSIAVPLLLAMSCIVFLAGRGEVGQGTGAVRAVGATTVPVVDQSDAAIRADAQATGAVVEQGGAISRDATR